MGEFEGGGSFIPDADEAPENRNLGLFWGTIVDNKDPANSGRCKFHIPGLTRRSTTWASPAMMLGNGGKHGIVVIPKIGSVALVGFVQGDINEPVYFGGPARDGEQVDGINPDSIVFQSDNFRIVFREQNGQRVLRMENLRSDLQDPTPAQSFIEITLNGGDKGTTHAVRIHSAASLSITAGVGVEINAPVVNIKGRPVAVTPEPI